MQFRASRQVTTGLMVNEKVNIRQEYWRAARQMCQALFTTGTYYRMVPRRLVGGALGDPPAKQEFTTLKSDRRASSPTSIRSRSMPIFGKQN